MTWRVKPRRSTDPAKAAETASKRIEHARGVAESDQQICHWIMAHKLEAYRVCNGFRIDELGLGEPLSALRARRYPLGSRS